MGKNWGDGKMGREREERGGRERGEKGGRREERHGETERWRQR